MSPSTSASTSPSTTDSPQSPQHLPLAKGVFACTAGVVLLALLFALLLPEVFNKTISTLNSTVVNSIGWYYVLVVTGFVGFALVVAISKLGDIRLGRDDDEPEYGLVSWFAMLFAAGMGIGLVFWGAAEPLTFYASEGPSGIPPNATHLDDAARAQRSLGQVFLHWGLHAWAIYVVAGLAIAYAVHRRRRPISIRWALEPVLGKRTDTWMGDAIDVIALVGTLFGIATSLGFGVNQIAAGLEHLGIIPASTALRVTIVISVTALATISAATGVDKGIKILSNLNLSLAALLMISVLILGPTLFLFRDLVANIGYYLQNVIQLSFQTMPFLGDDGATWISSWTTYYWGWWISWSPFVGVFIARISRGRTVREFIMGVLLVPSLVTILWFTVMGGTALYKSLYEGKDFTGGTGSINADTALFEVFNTLPGGMIMSGVAVLLVTIFFITSADSGTFVMDMIAHRGDTNPPRLTRIFWASASGAIAAVLIWVGSLSSDDPMAGMAGLQALALLSALPFSVVMIGMCISIWRALAREVKMIERIELRLRQQAFVERWGDTITESVSERVSERVGEDVMKSVETSVNAQVQESVAAHVEEAVAAQVQESVAVHVEDTVAAQVQETVAAHVEETVAAQVQQEVSSQLQELNTTGDAPDLGEKPGPTTA